MNPRLLELALKKQRLQLKASAQRLQLAQQLQAWAPAFAAADAACAAARWLGTHPQWLVGAAAVLLVVKPRAFFRWLSRGFFAWQALRRMRKTLESVLPRP